MQVDIQWVQQWFEQFNRMYFDGGLPTPRFRVGRSRTQLGSMAYKHKRRLLRSQLYDFTLTLSNYYDQTEHEFQSVLLHEMIHLSIACSGVKDTSPHGVVFRGMMARLNQDGWGIAVTSHSQNRKQAYQGSATPIRQYLVLAIETHDGRFFLSSVNPKSAHDLERCFVHVPEVKHHTWYTTDDRWFEQMPKVRSLRGRRVTEEVYREKVDTMKAISF